MDNQRELFPQVHPTTGRTQEEGVKATMKLHEYISARTHDHSRGTFNKMIAVLNHGMRQDRPLPTKEYFAKLKSVLIFGDELPEESSLKDTLSLYIEHRRVVLDYLALIHECPVFDYFGHVAGEMGALNNKDQFFTPYHVVEMMVKMTLGDHNLNGKHLKIADPACGTGRFSLYTCLHYDNLSFFSNDIDIDMVRAAMLSHWIFFPMTRKDINDRQVFWFFVCGDTLSVPEIGDPNHLLWFHSNCFDQPTSLRTGIKHVHEDNERTVEKNKRHRREI